MAACSSLVAALVREKTVAFAPSAPAAPTAPKVIPEARSLFFFPMIYLMLGKV